VGLQHFVDRHCIAAIEHRASRQLKIDRPQLSAANFDLRLRCLGGVFVAAIAAGAVTVPAVTHLTLAVIFLLLFSAWTALRLFALTKPNIATRLTTPHPHDLPEYTIIVALYREAPVVGRLVAALNTLRYPREKIDIKLVVEPDDFETRDAIAQLAPDMRYQIVVAPTSGPRTKPKALNAALPFARGEFTAVYDAEDRPDPDQLVGALDCFWRNGEKLACVQGRLTIDNTADSCLTRLFTAEYCGLFDVFLPALASWRLPLPLGGSSNHFRTAALREVGGWDPYNVTEDADLGIRLARHGYTTAVISSTTYEEAPAHLEPWLKQRSRWFKGWMQTWAVHMRSPRNLYRQLGPAGFIVFQLVVGGTALAALVHPLFAGALIYGIATHPLLHAHDQVIQVMLEALHSTTFIAGYLASTLLALVGLARRNLLKHASVLVLMPMLWGLLSLAAWRGLIQLLRDPYRWEKTEHGLAQTSRQAEES
jgi:cellulose synthase/poly-beta-1,6-N-acetylglucosamine synthase-like glycosyltransferase